MNIPAFLTFKKDHRFCDDPFPFLPNIKKKERVAPSFILRWDQLWSLSFLRWRFLLTPMTVIPANDVRHKTNNARVCVLSPVCGASLSSDLSVVVVVVVPDVPGVVE